MMYGVEIRGDEMRGEERRRRASFSFSTGLRVGGVE